MRQCEIQIEEERDRQQVYEWRCCEWNYARFFNNNNNKTRDMRLIAFFISIDIYYSVHSYCCCCGRICISSFVHCGKNDERWTMTIWKCNGKRRNVAKTRCVCRSLTTFKTDNNHSLPLSSLDHINESQAHIIIMIRAMNLNDELGVLSAAHTNTLHKI